MKYDDKFVKCPFFVAETASAIKCEGVFSKYQMHIFSSALKKQKWIGCYCKNQYCACKNYKEVNEKYKK